MSKVRKLHFKNIYGIVERDLTPGDITIFEGRNEAGKTGILDAINTALTNKGVRSRIVRNGETECELYIELDDGTTIVRKKRTNMSDYIQVKNGKEIIGSPESWLKNLFSENQFNPIKDFIDLKPKQQAKVILSTCIVPWDKEDWTKNFGEIPEDVVPEKHILANLDKIQSVTGSYYKKREELNRDAKLKKAYRDEILSTLPEGYKADDWRDMSLNELYDKVSKAQEHNSNIEKAKLIIDNLNDKILGIEGQYAKKVADIKDLYEFKKQKKANEIESLKDEIKNIEKRINQLTVETSQLDELQAKDIENAEKEKNQAIEHQNDLAVRAEGYTKDKELIDLAPLQENAKQVERMKSYIREFDKASGVSAEIREIQEASDSLTTKIERARELPLELLEKSEIPIHGIEFKDGELLIDGLPIDCLSEGRQYDIALKVAMTKTGELKLILMDGFEKFDSIQREKFIKKAKETGMQWFITRVADNDGVKVIEL